jgi:hypothetical protein
MTVRAPDLTLGDLQLNSRPGAAGLQHVSDAGGFSAPVRVIEIQNDGVTLATIQTRMSREIREQAALSFLPQRQVSDPGLV